MDHSDQGMTFLACEQNQHHSCVYGENQQLMHLLVQVKHLMMQNYIKLDYEQILQLSLFHEYNGI